MHVCGCVCENLLCIDLMVMCVENKSPRLREVVGGLIWSLCGFEW